MKNQKGITLVALVVTIVVLLILAGITIALVMNPESSIFGNARDAKTQTNSESVKELVSTAFSAAQTNYLVRDKDYKDMTDEELLGDNAAQAFTADLVDEAEKLGLTFTNVDKSGSGEKKVEIVTNDPEEPKTLKGFQLTDAIVTYGSSDQKFTVTINTSAEEPAERITVTEGAKAE